LDEEVLWLGTASKIIPATKTGEMLMVCTTPRERSARFLETIPKQGAELSTTKRGREAKFESSKKVVTQGFQGPCSGTQEIVWTDKGRGGRKREKTDAH